MRHSLHITISFLFIISTISFYSCGGSGEGSSTSDEIDKAIENETDSSQTKLIKFNDVVFSVPSPYQFAFFIKNLGITYNKEYLNPTKSVHNYSSSFKQAVNMGIYGTDLGYLNIYEQVPDAIEYFATLKVLSQEVGIANTFDSETLERIESNMGDKDSLLYILSNKYREADASLKDNDRNSIAVLILAGGWIESLYILTEVAKDNSTKTDIQQKIAEQKHPLDNLIKILSPYYSNSEEHKNMLNQLIDLAYVYDGVTFTYTYKEPIVDPAKKLTTVNSTSELIINELQLTEISEKISDLRKSVIN